VRDGVRACAGYPALLGFAVGNRLQSPGWHGRRRIERFIERLYEATKEVDTDRQPRHLCKLSDDRVPPAAVP
jgi:hypothetical protein